ncbi:MAG: tRNA(His) guanylyltransferase Thg1 family protein [Methanobacterium sp.]|jgi:tRNA(His) 5'-end guanylyltransferase
MKECEIFSNLKVPCGSEIVARIDGRKFSRLSHDFKFEKPFDMNFAKFMVNTSIDFFKEFSPRFIYIFSDEINIILSDIPFGGRIEKLNSVFASFMAGSFTKNVFDNGIQVKRPISFDSRIIPLSSALVVEYFKERQNEAWRNCINGYAYWTLRTEYSKKEAMYILKNKKSSDLHDILFERNINMAELPSWQRRGVGIYKKEIIIEGYNPVEKKKVRSKRKRIYVDSNLPIFDDQFFSETLIKG